MLDQTSGSSPTRLSNVSTGWVGASRLSGAPGLAEMGCVPMVVISALKASSPPMRIDRSRSRFSRYSSVAMKPGSGVSPSIAWNARRRDRKNGRTMACC